MFIINFMGNFQSNNINIDNLSIKKQLKINVYNIILLKDERLAISSYNQGMVICKQYFNKEEDSDIIIPETKNSSNLFLLSDGKLIAYLNEFFLIEILSNNCYKIIYKKSFNSEIKRIIELSNKKIVMLFNDYISISTLDKKNNFQIELIINTMQELIENYYFCSVTEANEENFLIHGYYNKIVFYSLIFFQQKKYKELPNNYILNGLFFVINKNILVYYILNYKKEKEIIFMDIKTCEIKEKIIFNSQILSAYLLLNESSFLLSYIKNNNSYFRIYSNNKFHKEKNLKIKEIFKCILYSKKAKRIISLSDNFLFYLE